MSVLSTYQFVYLLNSVGGSHHKRGDWFSGTEVRENQYFILVARSIDNMTASLYIVSGRVRISPCLIRSHGAKN